MAALDRGGGQIVEVADMPQQYAALDKAGRAGTAVIEPSRGGRDALTADIRDALTRSGALTGPAVMLESLANKGLTRTEARDPLSYGKGDVVRFTHDYVDKGLGLGRSATSTEQSSILSGGRLGTDLDHSSGDGDPTFKTRKD